MENITPSAKMKDKGQAAFKAGQFLEAARFFDQAASNFLAQQDPLTAAEMQNNRSVALLKAGFPQDALAATLGTDEQFANAGDAYRQAIALGNQAAAYEGLGELDKALSCYQLSSDLLKTLNEKEMRAFVLQNISAVQMRMGKQLEAMASMNTALESKKGLSIREKLLKNLLKVPFRMMGVK
jgi:tetratricopeptide (TPR) repeat protein